MNTTSNLFNSDRLAAKKGSISISDSNSQSAIRNPKSKIANADRALLRWRWHRLGYFLNGAKARLAASLVLLAFGLASPSWSDPAQPKENRYFLTLDQKKELIARGEISDAQGNRYNVRIVPGYVNSIETAKDGIKESKDAFRKYATAEPLRGVSDSYRDGSKTIANDVIAQDAKEIATDWRESFKKAARATELQTFGWPAAYPWELTRAVLSTVACMAEGTVETGGYAGYHYVVRPAYEMLEPLGEGTFVGLGKGIAGPSALVSLNSVVAPPLALLGRKPSPERADGFFVVIVERGKEVEMERQVSEAGRLTDFAEDAESKKETEVARMTPPSISGGCCAFTNALMMQQEAMLAVQSLSRIPQ